MSLKKIFSLCIILIPLTLNSQSIKIFTIPNTENADTLSFCRDSNIVFFAANPDSTKLPSETFFEWNYGNGISESGLNLDSVANVYSQSGGYFVFVKAITQAKDTLWAKKFVRLGFKPVFKGTNTDADTASICFDGINNDQIQLNAQFEYPVWKLQPVTENIESTEREINLGKAFTSVIYRNEYEINHHITSAQDIDTVAVLMEHTNAQELEIQLACPDGKSIKLKSVGTQKVFMGEPVDNEEKTLIAGNTYWYFFTEKTPNYGTMAQEEGQYYFSYTDNTDSSYINEPYYPEGSYLPQESFSNLQGCPLNGSWQLAVLDNNLENNGYIKSWKLIFDSVPPLIQYQNKSTKTFWKSSAFGHFLSDSALLSVTAEALKTNTFLNFKFTSTDNFGCPADTTIYVEVQKADFSANPASGDAELEVNFTNLTNWAEASFDWDFADGESAINKKDPTHTFTDKGEYEVVMTATSNQGCVNYDTLKIMVTAPVSKIEVPNVFTPNNDGINDRFVITHEGLRDGKIIIYSRWGEKVAELSNLEEIDAGWDGTIGNRGNKVIKPGLYYFTVIAEGKDDKKHRISGALHLFYGE